MLQSCQAFGLDSEFKAALLKAVDQDQSYLDTVKWGLKGNKNVDTSFSIVNDLLYYINRWYIPKDETLRGIIMKTAHDLQVAGYFETYKTIGRVRTSFWSLMDEYITEYVCYQVRCIKITKLSGTRSMGCWSL